MWSLSGLYTCPTQDTWWLKFNSTAWQSEETENNGQAVLKSAKNFHKHHNPLSTHVSASKMLVINIQNNLKKHKKHKKYERYF